MSNFEHEVIERLMKHKKYNAVTSFVHIAHPNKKDVFVTEYAGNNVRMFCDEIGNIHVVCPEEMTAVQESALIHSIETGEIYDDAEEIGNTAKYLQLTTLPYRAMTNKDIEEPKKLQVVTTGILGEMNPSGNFEITDVKATNACNFMNDALKHEQNKHEVREVIDHYLGSKQEVDSLPKDLRYDVNTVPEEIDRIKDISVDDTITDADYDEMEIPGLNDKHIGHDDTYEEGFFTKRPKKLKPIPRDVVAYITVEMNAIQDTNDQAMLSGYTCSKLELVDFYLNVIDTNDQRYIVPHTREYLVQIQNDLNRLLKQILSIKPINRADRVWKANVTYPEGWRG